METAEQPRQACFKKMLSNELPGHAILQFPSAYKPVPERVSPVHTSCFSYYAMVTRAEGT